MLGRGLCRRGSWVCTAETARGSLGFGQDTPHHDGKALVKIFRMGRLWFLSWWILAGLDIYPDLDG